MLRLDIGRIDVFDGFSVVPYKSTRQISQSNNFVRVLISIWEVKVNDWKIYLTVWIIDQDDGGSEGRGMIKYDQKWIKNMFDNKWAF